MVDKLNYILKGVYEMKRSILTIKQYDYTSIEEFKKDSEEMIKKGYILLDEKYLDGKFNHGEVTFGKWKYTACYMKDNI